MYVWDRRSPLRLAVVALMVLLMACVGEVEPKFYELKDAKWNGFNATDNIKNAVGLEGLVEAWDGDYWYREEGFRRSAKYKMVFFQFDNPITDAQRERILSLGLTGDLSTHFVGENIAISCGKVDYKFEGNPMRSEGDPADVCEHLGSMMVDGKD